jgi:hypothetical protein
VLIAGVVGAGSVVVDGRRRSMTGAGVLVAQEVKTSINTNNDSRRLNIVNIVNPSKKEPQGH